MSGNHVRTKGNDTGSRKVIIVGGGLVGALNACFLAKRGYQVAVYELRDDIRKRGAVRGRSINLTLSAKGTEALLAVGLKELIRDNGIPIYGRVIHEKDGTKTKSFYGKKNEFILSLDRRRVNELLLSAAQEYHNVQIMFNHKFLCCDFEEGTATFRTPDNERVTHKADLIVGCDGAYSSVRSQMMKCTKMDFSQTYLNHGYMELRIPARRKKTVSVADHHLHVWPRDKFLLLSFPDLADNNYVSTLVMPFNIFDRLTTKNALLDFFNEHFPDFLDFIGIERDDLVQTFFSREPLSLVSVKCKPYHLGNNAIFMGDAAHAMVPFYGQGMNCGFEDCLVFDKILEDCHDDFAKALTEFSIQRNRDAEAMVDLSMRQYTILMSKINTTSYKWRKVLDEFLHWLLPDTWLPIYTSVAFTNMPYSECIENRNWQDQVLKQTKSLVVIALTIFGTVAIFKLNLPQGFLRGCSNLFSFVTDLLGCLRTQ